MDIYYRLRQPGMPLKLRKVYFTKREYLNDIGGNSIMENEGISLFAAVMSILGLVVMIVLAPIIFVLWLFCGGNER